MRVLIDATYATRAPRSGTAVYIRRVIDELGRIDGLDVVEAVDEHRRQPAGGGFGSARNMARDQWWVNVELPRVARRAGADLIHHPLPARSYGARLPQAVTVVDLAFERLPDHFDRAFRTYAHVTHRAAALAAGAVICISETTADDARELWGVRSERIVVAKLGPGQPLAAIHAHAEPSHFLYVGDAEPRKDLATLLEAYTLYRADAEAPLRLVLAGSASAAGPGISLERSPSAARLAELFAGAAALVHPSLYEGFGMTPTEAMSVGTPVLAARAPAVTEICADAVMYAPPGDPASFASAMRELATRRDLREQLRVSGRARAAELSWSACACAHRDAYSLALEQR